MRNVPYSVLSASPHVHPAQESQLGRKIVASGVDLRSTHSYLAAYLLQEKAKGTKSYWSVAWVANPNGFELLLLLTEPHASASLFAQIIAYQTAFFDLMLRVEACFSS